MVEMYLIFGDKFKLGITKDNALLVLKELEYSAKGFGLIQSLVEEYNIARLMVLYPGVLDARRYSNAAVGTMCFDKLLQYPDSDLQLLNSFNCEVIIIDVCEIVSQLAKEGIASYHFMSAGFVSCYVTRDDNITSSFRCQASMMESRLQSQNIQNVYDLTCMGNELSSLFFTNAKALAYCKDINFGELELIGRMRDAKTFKWNVKDLLSHNEDISNEEKEVTTVEESVPVIEEDHSNIPIKTPQRIQRTLRRRALNSKLNILASIGLYLVVPAILLSFVTNIMSAYAQSDLSESDALLSQQRLYVDYSNKVRDGSAANLGHILGILKDAGVKVGDVQRITLQEDGWDIVLQNEFPISETYSNVSCEKDDLGQFHIIVH